jgi:hypothetical protein
MPAGFTEAVILAGVLVPLFGAMLSQGSVSVAVKELDPPVLVIVSVRAEGELPPI